MRKKDFPSAPSIRKMIGPSFVILALGLGSGEIILWPYLAANHGLGIAWGALLGITFQFFMNMEIERYAVLKGESVFVGIRRLARWPAYWFIVSTFLGFGLPGIIAASAKILASAAGWSDFRWLAVGMLVFCGLILSVGRTVYGMMEKITKAVILLGVPFIFFLTLYLSDKSDWGNLAKGLIGMGDGFVFLPENIGLAVFLGAFAYAGAGGNLNLTQSIYVKEKGYGMGAYAQKISGLFSKKGNQEIHLEGTDFEVNDANTRKFKDWWRKMNIEHGLIFWLVGGFSILMLMLLSFITVYGGAGNATGIDFVLKEAGAIGERTAGILGVIFLVAAGIMLFQTQLGIMDSTSRIMAENYALEKMGGKFDGAVNLSGIYRFFVWAQIVFGCSLLIFKIHEPRALITLGAVFNAFAMAVHVFLVRKLNRTSLPKVFQPGLARRAIMLAVLAFFAFFSVVVLAEKIGLIR